MPTSALSSVSDLEPSEARYSSRVMDAGLVYLNQSGKTQCLDSRNDSGLDFQYVSRMANARKPKASPRWDWYLKDWMLTLGKIQADLEKDLEWNKSKASFMYNYKQRYHREDVNQVAEWLQIEPYELLMHPSDAMHVRKLRARELEVVATGEPRLLVAKPDVKRARAVG